MSSTPREVILTGVVVILNILTSYPLSPYSTTLLPVGVATSSLIVLAVGILVGVLGNLLVAIAEAASLIAIFTMRFSMVFSITNIVYALLPYIMGVTLGSSLFRRFHMSVPRTYLGRGKISDLLLITGVALMFMYVIYRISTSYQTPVYLFSRVKLSDFKFQLTLTGLVLNTFITTLLNNFYGSTLRSLLTYISLGLACSLSWFSTPLTLVVVGSEYGPHTYGTYISLGVATKKLVSSGRGWTPVFGKLVRVDMSSESNKHIVVVGMSGTGKSSLAKKVIKQIHRGAAVIVIDPHGEYVSLTKELSGRVITPLEAPVNPLDTLGKPKNVRAEEVSDMVRRVFKLGNIQKYALYNVILDTYIRVGDAVPTFNDVYATLINYVERDIGSREGYYSKDVLKSLIPYVDILRGPYLSTSSIKPSELFEGFTVIDLSVVDSEFVRGVYVETVMSIIETYMRSLSKPALLIVDEAHRFMGGRAAPILSRLTMEGRKFGLNLMVITQQPLDVDPAIMANAAYIISFAVQEVNNLNYISRVLSGGYGHSYNSIRAVLPHLKKFEAIVREREGNDVYIIKT